MMRKRWTWMAVVALVTALLLVGVWLQRTPPAVSGMPVHGEAAGDRGGSPASVEQGRTRARAQAGTTAKPGAALTDPLSPLWSAPRDLVVERFAPLARAGHADAMRILASALRDCEQTDRGTDEEISRHTIDSLVGMEMNPAVPIGPMSTARIKVSIDSLIALRDQCNRVDRTEIARSLDWFDRAAQAGDTLAMRDYAQTALDDVKSAESPLVDPQEIERRKARALDYMNRALQLGDCLVLLDFGQQYAGEAANSLFAPDAAAAYAYTYARWLWESELNPNMGPPERMGWTGLFARRTSGVDPIALESPRARGEAIYREYCLHQPMNVPPM